MATEHFRLRGCGYRQTLSKNGIKLRLYGFSMSLGPVQEIDRYSYYCADYYSDSDSYGCDPYV